MKKRFTAFIFLSWLIATGIAWAEYPVQVSHTLTSYATGTDMVTLNYNVTVINTSANSIANITLTHVPLLIVTTDQLTLNIATLDSQAETQLHFTITSPMLLDESEFRSQPLFWAGTCTDSIGSQVEFPSRSNEGGGL